MKYLLKTLLTPSCWLRPEFTNYKLDHKINELINNKSSVKLPRLSTGSVYYYTYDMIGPASVELGGMRIWTGNYPFSYGGCYLTNYAKDLKGLPSRKTVFKLKEYIDLHWGRLIEDSLKFENLYKNNYLEYVKQSIEYYQGN